MDIVYAFLEGAIDEEMAQIQVQDMAAARKMDEDLLWEFYQERNMQREIRIVR